MKRALSLLAAALTAGLLSSCSPPSAPAKSGVTKGTPSTPVPVVTKSGIHMVYLPGGEYTMGSNHGNPDEAPAHKVRVSAFLMDQYEVTHAMFVKVELPDPSHWQSSSNDPVEQVRWLAAKQYCNERSRLEGLTPCYNEKTVNWTCNYKADGYRLPTEAEWEYACRAGSQGPYDFNRPDQLRQYAWYAANSGKKAHPVGEKRANAWGLYDMDGNVSEWCEDVYSPTYYQHSPVLNPHGPSDPGHDVDRVLRGGNWKANADMCRDSFRQGQHTGDTDACFNTDFIGFRCVRRPTAAELRQLLAKSR